MPADVRIAAYGVLVQDGAVLLTHWNEEGRTGWTLPGGGLEDLESAQQAAVREIAEETGYRADLGPVLGVDSRFVAPADRMHPNGDRPLHALRIVFAARVTGGELAHEVGGSSDEARWVPLDRVAELPLVSLVPLALGWWREHR
ncbi:NUDIX hydrolase [Nakamurella endophytica]|uniref:NUDIX hydrolase n=1 Tax=Nakamurella endophytica TaxID=1748367 RepID=UPI00227CCCCB|nr:NUDIX domain-containing protein [Nakamurella endophytica]